MNDSKSILLKILDTIGYADDKEAFANKFLENVHLQSLLNLIQSLPADKQNEAKQKLTENSNNPEEIASVLKEYFSQSEMQQSLQKSAQDAVNNYIQSINNSLSNEQRQNLIKVVEEVHQNTPQPV